MRAPTPLVIVGLVAFAMLAGCISDADPEGTPDATASSSAAASPTTTATSGSDDPVVSEPIPPIANLTVNMTNGSVPLNVSFAILDDSGADQENVSWTLDFGDGNTTNGTSLPGRTEYAYAANGTFEVLLTITTDAGDSTDNETITAVGGSSAVPPPSKTVYESGPVLGCVSEGGHDACPAYVAGPGDEEGLGLWVQIEPGHVGMSFAVTETTNGDSDGWLFADPAGDPLPVNINNGGNEAKGVIPPEAKWMLIISWATPSDNMVVTFSPAE